MVDKLFDVFQEELKRQNDQRTQGTAKNLTLRSMWSMIDYKQIKYVDDFNAILYNIILTQEKRNAALTFKEIEDKIESAAKEQIEKYDQYTQSVGSDEGKADSFVLLVIEQLIEVLQEELLEQFDSKIFEIETKFNKEDNMKEAFKAFKEAEDSETIIQHMMEPVELERRVFKDRYIKTSHSYANQLIEDFDKLWKEGLTNCQDFIKNLNETFQGKTQRAGLPP